MSLKIYDAYIINIPSPNIYNLQQIFDNLRTEITNATMASIQKKIVKNVCTTIILNSYTEICL